MQTSNTNAVLSKDIRDHLSRMTSFSAQEIFFLWEVFSGYSSGLTFLTPEMFDEWLDHLKISRKGSEWLHSMLDTNGDGSISFGDWLVCADKSCRSPLKELLELCCKGLSDDDMVYEIEILGERAKFVYEHFEVDYEKEKVEKDLERLIALGNLDAQIASTEMIQLLMRLVVNMFLEDVYDMQLKLKRFPVFSLVPLCVWQKDRVPFAIRNICERILKIRDRDEDCGNFNPETLYVHRDLIEALSNAYTCGFVPEEGVNAPVLLMVLRTFLRQFVEPLFTLHFSRQLLEKCGNSEAKQIQTMQAIVRVLPSFFKETLTVVVECGNKVCVGSKSADSLARVLAYCLIRPEAKPQSTAPLSVELTRVLLLKWNQIRG